MSRWLALGLVPVSVAYALAATAVAAHHGELTTYAGRSAEKELSLQTMVNIADSVVLEEVASRQECELVIEELTAYSRDPNTRVAAPRVFQVWGVKGAKTQRR